MDFIIAIIQIVAVIAIPLIIIKQALISPLEEKINTLNEKIDKLINQSNKEE